MGKTCARHRAGAHNDCPTLHCCRPEHIIHIYAYNMPTHIYAWWIDWLCDLHFIVQLTSNGILYYVCAFLEFLHKFRMLGLPGNTFLPRLFLICYIKFSITYLFTWKVKIACTIVFSISGSHLRVISSWHHGSRFTANNHRWFSGCAFMHV